MFLIYISAEIIMFEGLTCVYRSNVDLFFYVVGSTNENEVSLEFFAWWYIMHTDQYHGL
jgi:hypothetical protein